MVEFDVVEVGGGSWSPTRPSSLCRAVRPSTRRSSSRGPPGPRRAGRRPEVARVRGEGGGGDSPARARGADARLFLLPGELARRARARAGPRDGVRVSARPPPGERASPRAGGARPRDSRRDGRALPTRIQRMLARAEADVATLHWLVVSPATRRALPCRRSRGLRLDGRTMRPCSSRWPPRASTASSPTILAFSAALRLVDVGRYPYDLRTLRRMLLFAGILAALCPGVARADDPALPPAVPPGVVVAGVDLSGMTRETALAALRTAFAQPLTFHFRDQRTGRSRRASSPRRRSSAGGDRGPGGPAGREGPARRPHQPVGGFAPTSRCSTRSAPARRATPGCISGI